MKQYSATAIIWLLALFVAGCGNDTPDSDAVAVEPSAAELEPADGIAWFDGSVEEAFAVAKASGKPVFLYWGAVWCPPCHAIAATVFKSPEFIERSQLFVPVYLDGDTENAQAHGEEFGVLGYPTMIVFNSNGEELTRIPGGIDIQAYANILDLTLQNSSSVNKLLARLLADNQPLSASDCTLLAYYSWGQDTKILADLDEADTFRRMYSACPDEVGVARSVLYFSWLDAALTAADDEKHPVPLSDAQKVEALAAIERLLGDDELIKANIFPVLFSGADFTRSLTDVGGDARAALTEHFIGTYDRLAADETLYKRERIYTLRGKILFERIDDEEADLSADLMQEIRATVAWADETTPGVYERQPIINALGNVLLDANMDEDANTLLLAELDKSKQPYYYMVTLADIEQRAGNYDVAIDWLKQAHDIATGSATRFQWGYYYLAGLLEMTPDDTQTIHDTTVSLIAELQQGSGFYQRPKAQMQRLQARLLSWSDTSDKQPALQEIRASVLKICASVAAGSESRRTCEAFLETA